jgi:copper chaperone CopZ
MHDYLHHVPGRLRVRVPAIKRNEYEAGLLRSNLETIDGIEKLEINMLTGSVTINYDRATTTSSSIMAGLARHGASRRFQVERSAVAVQAPSGQGTVNGVVENVGKAFFGVMLEKALERSALALIAAVV